ncbi:MAG: class I SAM-dependent methyltransferase [Anaerolineales bacterium]|nr:class I SAM-dependent methyltransferase [Anaerolineales bacterium]
MDQEQIKTYINELLDIDSRNIARELKRRALAETCDYIETNMPLVNSGFENRFELLEHATGEAKIIDGLWLEFGVYTGSTIKFIAERTTAFPVYGFDSFEGNPEDWRSEYKKGAFALDTPPVFPNNILIVRGLFQDTFPKFLGTNKENIAFVHIDCDLYSSAKIIFDMVGHRFINGTIIVFDEFFNYPGWKNHEFRAFMEFIESNNRKFEYIGYVYKHSQVAIRILS